METTQARTTQSVRLLLLGEKDKDLADLQELLRQAWTGQLRLDCVHSSNEVFAQIQQGQYDALMCDAAPGDDVARELPLQPPKIPVVFISSPDEWKITSELQSIFCRYRSSEPCPALAMVNAIHRYRKEKQRQSSEEMLSKLRRTVEQSTDLVMITDRCGVLEYVNPAFEALTGYTRDEVTGQTLGILKSEQQSGELYEEMWDTVLSGRVFHGIVRNRKKNGETFILQKSIGPLRNVNGEITHFISTGRDITDQCRLESELQQAQKMDAIGRLAGGVAHDFNNLLMVISAYAELMQDGLTEDDPLRQNVSEIMTAARRAAELTRQLLAFSRKQVQSLQLLDLNSIIRELSQMLPRLIGEDIQFVFLPGENLGKVKADPVQIEQVLMNLAANARDAMPQGGRLTIETANVSLDEAYVERHSIVPPGDYVLLSVSDSGLGIPPEHQAHIFEPFYTTKEEGKGTGLGLATVYGIVKQSKGFIWVYSEAGMGSVFKIYLPQAKASATAARTVVAREVSPHGRETLLLAEDEGAVRHSSREFLTRCGYTVLEAENGEEALRISREYCGPIHLLISDVVMPKMSGPKLAELLSAERPHLKVLFVSGYAERTVLQHGKVDISACFLEKPCGLSDLAKKVREVLDGGAPLAHAATSSG